MPRRSRRCRARWKSELKRLFGVARAALRGQRRMTHRDFRRHAGVQRGGERRAAGARDRGGARGPRISRCCSSTTAAPTTRRRRSWRRAQAGIPQMRLLRHSFRSGQSAAVATGVRHARARWIGTLDGDGQNDPADLPKLLAARCDPGQRATCGCSRAIARLAQGHLVPQAAVAHRQRRAQQPARRRHARHRLRHQAHASRDVPRACRTSITCIASCRRCSSAPARA